MASLVSFITVYHVGCKEIFFRLQLDSSVEIKVVHGNCRRIESENHKIKWKKKILQSCTCMNNQKWKERIQQLCCVNYLMMLTAWVGSSIYVTCCFEQNYWFVGWNLAVELSLSYKMRRNRFNLLKKKNAPSDVLQTHKWLTVCLVWLFNSSLGLMWRLTARKWVLGNIWITVLGELFRGWRDWHLSLRFTNGLTKPKDKYVLLIYSSDDRVGWGESLSLD